VSPVVLNCDYQFACHIAAYAIFHKLLKYIDIDCLGFHAKLQCKIFHLLPILVLQSW